MKARKNNNRIQATLAVLGLVILLLNFYAVDVTPSMYNDNTTVLTKLNVSNVAPWVSDMTFYKVGTGSGLNIVLEEATTINVRCNGTINDTNGLADISNVNATIYKYAVDDAEDNNSKYFNGSCNQATVLDALAATYTCDFVVEYYADNGTWTCNLSALDTGSLVNSTLLTKDVDPLYALSLDNDTISFGELKPNEELATDRTINVTNTGNMNLSIGLRAYGTVEEDLQAMDCTVGNISQTYERYSLDSAQAWSGKSSLGNERSLFGNSGVLSKRSLIFLPFFFFIFNFRLYSS